jgi:hypothetical protein
MMFPACIIVFADACLLHEELHDWQFAASCHQIPKPCTPGHGDRVCSQALLEAEDDRVIHQESHVHRHLPLDFVVQQRHVCPLQEKHVLLETVIGKRPATCEVSHLLFA